MFGISKEAEAKLVELAAASSKQFERFIVSQEKIGAALERIAESQEQTAAILLEQVDLAKKANEAAEVPAPEVKK